MPTLDLTAAQITYLRGRLVEDRARLTRGLDANPATADRAEPGPLATIDSLLVLLAAPAAPVTDLDVPCVTRTFHGGRDTVSLRAFAEHVIQDWDVALNVADQLVCAAGDAYEWNAEEPDVYETFEVSDIDALRRAVTCAHTDHHR